MIILVTKTLLAVGLSTLFYLVLHYQSRLNTYFGNKGTGTLCIAVMWLALRLVPFTVLYVLLGFKATSDLIGFYNGAVAAHQGLTPYRDFVTTYAPFFSYITAIPIVFWDDARAIVVLMMVIEGQVLWGTYKLYRLPLTTVLMYLLLPASMLFCVVGGQEDIWMWGFALLTIPLMRRNHALAVGAMLGLALVVTKSLFILFVPAVFFWTTKKVRLVIGMLAVGVPVLTWLYLTGKWAFLMPMQITQNPLAPNLRSVLHPFFAGQIDHIPLKLNNYIALVTIIVLSSLLTLRWKKDRISYPLMLARSWVLIYSLIILLVPSAYAVYAFGFMLPLMAGGLAGWQQGRPLLALLLFNFLTVIQPSVWWRLGQHMYLPKDLTNPRFLTEYLMEIGILGCLVYFVVTLWTASSTTFTLNRPTEPVDRTPNFDDLQSKDSTEIVR